MNDMAEFIKCKDSFSYFCKEYIKIHNPKRGLVNFKLFSFQENKVFAAFENERFVILKKFRQGGLSTLAAMYSLWKILFKLDIKILIISKSDREAINIMNMIRLAWDNLPDFLKCNTLEFNQHVMKLETGSEIRCRTPQMGRSFSANIIILDEAAFIPKMDEIWKSIFPTISAAGASGKAFVISTVNGLGNWYANIYHDAKDEKNDFKVVDLHYKEHPDYNNPQYVQTMKDNLGKSGWEQEVLGIFLSGAGTFIHSDIIKEIEENIKEDPRCKAYKKIYDDKLWIWKDPRRGKSYILCADVAEGLGEEHDYSAFHVLDMVTLEQVAEFCSNVISTYNYAKIIDEVGKYYNSALAIIESNSLGNGVLERLFNDLEYENLYWDRTSKRKVKMGFNVNQKNKPLIMNTFKNMVEEGHVKIKSTRLLHEIQTLEYNATTRKVQARSGRHDDLVTALSAGLFVRGIVGRHLPIGMEDEQDSDRYEPSFDPTYSPILQPNYDEIDDVQYVNMIGNHITDAYDDDDDEFLKDFGW